MESVAAERLNKLGKNPSIISTRHDLKRDAAVLKNIISRATPQVSSNSDSDRSRSPSRSPSIHSSSSSSSSRSSSSSSSSKSELGRSDLKSSLLHLHDGLLGSNRVEDRNERKRRRKKEEKKKKKESTTKTIHRTFLTAPSRSLFNSSSSPADQHSSTSRNILRKSPSTPWSLFRKAPSLSLSPQPPP